MELVWFPEARDLQTLMELVQFAGEKPADAGGLVWLAGARSASVDGETAARSILSV